MTGADIYLTGERSPDAPVSVQYAHTVSASVKDAFIITRVRYLTRHKRGMTGKWSD